MLPVAPYTETAGTFVNIEGRVQSFQRCRQARGDARPAWKVLRVLGNVLNLDGFAMNPAKRCVTKLLGKGAEFVAGLDNALNGVSISLPVLHSMDCSVLPMCRSILPIRWLGVPRHCSRRLILCSLQHVSMKTLAQIGKVWRCARCARQGSGEARLVAKIDNAVPADCVRVAAAHVSTAAGRHVRSISVERA
jgi:NADH-quinone oxidoreductase subunit G